jgi:hypothetical protein
MHRARVSKPFAVALGADVHEVDEAAGLPWTDDDADSVTGDGGCDAGEPAADVDGSGVINRRTEDGRCRVDGTNTRVDEGGVASQLSGPLKSVTERDASNGAGCGTGERRRTSTLAGEERLG